MQAPSQPEAPSRAEAPSQPARLAIAPSPRWQRTLEVAILAAKGVTIACAIDAWVNADRPRLRGKAMRTRAVGYTAGLFLVPAIWTMLPNHGRYPRGLDLAVTTPLLIDAVGNALGLYQDAHLDDVVHFLNAAIVSGVAGALFAGEVERPWHAAVAGAGASIAGETAWEITEYVALKAGARGMDLTYDDTMVDLAASSLGAIVGGVVTWLRMPRAKDERRRGWRHAVSGWRERGEPMAILGGEGTVADAAAGEVAPA
ncbi:MAG TPA: hypothetical protein VHS36_06940 [Candidatus Limnocylindrales bacterium]|nr:hypothetical protein [Candidatus Limnocylindrales bacterium]